MRNTMILSSEELHNIADRLIITEHAEERALARGDAEKLSHLPQSIANSQLGWSACNGDYKVQVGGKLLAILRRDHDVFVLITIYYCGGRKSHGVKKKSSMKIGEHFDRDRRLFKTRRTKMLLKSIS